jgi:hypothetical protein
MSSNHIKVKARRITLEYKGTDIKLSSQFGVEKVFLSNLTIPQNQCGSDKRD